MYRFRHCKECLRCGNPESMDRHIVPPRDDDSVYLDLLFP